MIITDINEMNLIARFIDLYFYMNIEHKQINNCYKIFFLCIPACHAETLKGCIVKTLIKHTLLLFYQFNHIKGIQTLYIQLFSLSKLLLYLTDSIILYFRQMSYPSFEEFKAQVFASIDMIASKAKEIYEDKCSLENSKCQKKAFNQCEGVDKKVCSYDFPKNQSCASSGVLVSNSAGSRLPKAINSKNLSNNEKLFICASYQMDETFKQVKKKHKHSVNRIYFGTEFGYFRVYPAQQQIKVDDNLCADDYDPRTRSWYAASTTNSKNVIILIDVSNSMVGSPLPKAQYLSKTIISTLQVNDFFAVVKFSSLTYEIMNPNKLYLQAIKKNRQSYMKKISELTVSQRVGNNSNIIVYDVVKDIISQSHSKQIAINCQNIVILFTDNNNQTETNIMIQKGREFARNSTKIKLFIYSIGSAQNQSSIIQDKTYVKLLKQEQILNPFNSLRNYYSYIKLGIDPNKAVWSQTYIDAVTKQPSIAVSKPLYYTSNNSNLIFGAGSIAIPLSTLAKYGISNQSEAMDKLINSHICVIQNSLTIVDIKQAQCQQYSVNGSIFEDPPVKNNKQRYQCCGLTKLTEMYLLIGIILGLFLIVLVGIFLCLWRRRKRLLQEIDQEIQQQSRTSKNIKNPSQDKVNQSGSQSRLRQHKKQMKESQNQPQSMPQKLSQPVQIKLD